MNKPDKLPSLPSIQHEYFILIWKTVKEGKLEVLEGEGKVLAHLMLEHPEYQYFWETPWAFGSIELEDALEQEQADPDLHLIVEQIVCSQVEKEDPPEVAKAYKALLKARVDSHEARHTIGRILTEVIWEVSHMAEKGEQVDEGIYIRELKRLAKHPVKVLNEQVRRLRESS